MLNKMHALCNISHVNGFEPPILGPPQCDGRGGGGITGNSDQ